MTSLTETIHARLVEALKPERLEVINESHMHAGHQPGFDGTGESHLRIRIVSAVFAGMPRLARHRTVTDLVRPELERGLHALAIEPAAPGEAIRW
ncbi:BolA family protein [Gellertiella hungarica]|uniref:BolA protein n=1 Tax=Gellertiella hungarica TaxID=1572859 RepID=A0A7W6J5H0_9HYPH|nr:BolA family protein [Gellertiella hungarica]MBB4065141.1 BolA protein [Gellertiella hungarica]